MSTLMFSYKNFIVKVSPSRIGVNIDSVNRQMQNKVCFVKIVKHSYLQIRFVVIVKHSDLATITVHSFQSSLIIARAYQLHNVDP